MEGKEGGPILVRPAVLMGALPLSPPLPIRSGIAQWANTCAALRGDFWLLIAYDERRRWRWRCDEMRWRTADGSCELLLCHTGSSVGSYELHTKCYMGGGISSRLRQNLARIPWARFVGVESFERRSGEYGMLREKTRLGKYTESTMTICLIKSKHP